MTTDLGAVEPGRPYTRPEVAALLRVCAATVARMIADGRLKSVTVGKRKRVLGCDLLAHVGLTHPPAMPDTAAERRRRAEANMMSIREYIAAARKRPKKSHGG